jgi:hypothetical protein
MGDWHQREWHGRPACTHLIKQNTLSRQQLATLNCNATARSSLYPLICQQSMLYDSIRFIDSFILVHSHWGRSSRSGGNKRKPFLLLQAMIRLVQDLWWTRDCWATGCVLGGRSLCPWIMMEMDTYTHIITTCKECFQGKNHPQLLLTGETTR